MKTTERPEGMVRIPEASEAASMKPAAVASLLGAARHEDLPKILELFQNDERPTVAKAVQKALRQYKREQKERERVAGMYRLMRELGGDGVIVGADEVGRGSVAGPLTVAAVILPDEPMIWGIDDSKKLTPARREELCEEIRGKALAIGICHVAPAEIDDRGMAACLRKAFAGAIEAAGTPADTAILDGFPLHVHPHEVSLTKGDAKVACIAAASIVAKVTRDALMVELDGSYPGYHLDACKGYASAEHIEAIKTMGLSPIHRRTFCQNFLQERLPGFEGALE